LASLRRPATQGIIPDLDFAASAHERRNRPALEQVKPPTLISAFEVNRPALRGFEPAGHIVVHGRDGFGIAPGR